MKNKPELVLVNRDAPQYIKKTKKEGSKEKQVIMKMDDLMTKQFVSPTQTLIVNSEWICEGVPCIVSNETETDVYIKPFNKKREFMITKDEFSKKFLTLELSQDDGGAYYTQAPNYPEGRLKLDEFLVVPISVNKLIKHFDNDSNIVTLIKKAQQDAYVSKGSTFCINMKDYTSFSSSQTKLERPGDPIFNRAPRHSRPVRMEFTREDFETTTSFPAPIGIRSEDFALPSEQNEILIQILSQIFNCKNAPDCPEDLSIQLGLTIVKNSHQCHWCGELMDIQTLSQLYCSKEHTVNFCHRDPKIGTRPNNVYLGHCSCNREQGGYSEQERVEQFIRLLKHNSTYREMCLASLSSDL